MHQPDRRDPPEPLDQAIRDAAELLADCLALISALTPAPPAERRATGRDSP